MIPQLDLKEKMIKVNKFGRVHSIKKRPSARETLCVEEGGEGNSPHFFESDMQPGGHTQRAEWKEIGKMIKGRMRFEKMSFSL